MKAYKATFKFKNGVIGQMILLADEAIEAIKMICNMLSQYDVSELNIKEAFKETKWEDSK